MPDPKNLKDLLLQQINNKPKETSEPTLKDYIHQDLQERPQSTDIQLGQYGVGESKYDIGVTPENISQLQEIRGQRQSSAAKLGAGFVNAITQTGLDVIKDASYLLDYRNVSDFTKQAENGFNNSLAEWLQAAEDKLKIPVYRTKASEGFSPLSAGWWGDNLPSIASTISMAIPAEGAVIGLSKLGKLMGGDKVIRAIEGATGVTNLSNNLKGITGAVLSRQMENLMEGSQTFNDTYNEAIGKGLDSEKARQVAGEAAATNYKANWTNLVTDIPQYMLLHKSFKQSLKDQQSGLQDIVKTMAQESGEEAYQYISNEESKRAALIKSGVLNDDKSNLIDRLSDYTKDGDFWTSAFLGGLGGGLFGVGSNIQNRRNLPKLQEQYESLAKLHAAIIKGDEKSFNRVSDDLFANELMNNIKEGNLDKFKSLLDMTYTIPESPEERIESSKKIHERKSIIDFTNDLKNKLASDPTLSPELKAEQINSAIHQKLSSKRLTDINNNISKLQSEDISILNLQDPTLYQFKLAKLRYEAIKDNKLFDKEAKELSKSINNTYDLLSKEGKSREDIDKELTSVNDTELISLLENRELELKRINNTKEVLHNLSTEEGRSRYQELANKAKEDNTKKEQKIKEETKPESIADTIINNEELTPEQIEALQEQEKEVEQVIKDKTIPKLDSDKFHIILHGDTDENDKGITRTKIAQLDENGINEANQNKQRLAEQGGIETLVSSPLDRTIHTSNIITDNQPFEIDNNLKAWDRGEYEGKPEKEFNERYWVEHPDEVIPEGESFNEYVKRTIDALKDIANNAHGNTAIVTHSGTEAILKAWEKAGKQGYNIDKDTFLNYKEDRSKPTTFVRGDFKGGIPETIIAKVRPDTQDLVSKSILENTIFSAKEPELDIKEVKGTLKQAHVAMMRMYDHIFELINDQKVFKWARTNSGAVKENISSKVSKDINNQSVATKGSSVNYKLVILDPLAQERTNEDIEESINIIKRHIKKGNPYKYSEDNNYGFGNSESIGIYQEDKLIGFYPLPHAIELTPDTNLKAETNKRNQIISERKAILDKLNKGEEVTTTITDKGRGNLLTKLTDKGKVDVKDINGNYKTIGNEILIRDIDKVNGKAIFIYNDGNQLKLPNVGDESNQLSIESEIVQLGNFGKPGQVFMLIKSANDTWYPAPVFATIINDNVVTQIIDTLKDLNPMANAMEIIRALNPYIYATTKEGGNITIKNPENTPSMITINGDNFTINDLYIPSRLQKFEDHLKTKYQNIDIKNINSLVGQQSIINRRALTTNIYTDNGQYMVQPFISLESIQTTKPEYKQVKGKEIEEEKVEDKKEKELTPEEIRKRISETFGDSKISSDEDDIAFKKGYSLDNKVDRVKAKEWLDKNLPGFKLANLDELAKFKELSIDTLGMYRNMTIYLFNGDNKILYHEAFHGVFRNILTNEERTKLLAESKLTEEELADKFEEFANGYENKSLGKKILDFFNRILNYFSIFTKYNQSKVDEIFDNIVSGKYRSKSLEARDLNKSFDSPAYKKIGNFGSTAKLYHTRNIGNAFIAIYKDQLDKGVAPSDIDPQPIFKSILAKYNNLLNKIAVNPKAFNKNVALSTLGVVDNYNLFVEEATKYISEQGIKLSKSNLEFQEAEFDEQDLGDEEETSLVGQTTKGFGDLTSIPGMKSASTRLKLFLSAIEVLDENQVPKEDEFGFIQYHDFKKLYYYIERNLVDLIDFKDMIDELNRLSIFRPELKQVVNKLQDETIDKVELKRLQNDFRSNFAKQQLVYTLIKFDTDVKHGNITPTYKIFDANRQSINREILASWQSNLTDPTRKTISEIIEGEAKLKGTREAIRLAKDWNVIKSSNDYNIINNFLLSYGIEFTPESLQVILQSKELPIFKKNIDIVVNWYSTEEDNNEKNFREALESLVKLETSSFINNYTSSFNNVENKSIYTLQLPSYASKLLANLGSVNENKFLSKYNELVKDPTYNSLNILQELYEDADFRPLFKLSYLDGLKDDRGDSKGSKFTKMSPKDFMSLELALFQNKSINDQKKTSTPIHKYVYLTPSDKTMCMVFDSKKYGVTLVDGKVASNSQIVQKYYNIALLEVKRIKKAIEDTKDLPKEKLLQYYHYLKSSDKLDGQAFKFNYLDNLNSLLPEINNLLQTMTAEQALAAINSKVIDSIVKELNKEVKDVVREAINKDLIEKREGEYRSIALDIQGDNNIKQLLAEYALNHRLANIELSHLLNGDIAYYKPGDLAKRTYQSSSMTISLNKLDKPAITAVAIDDLEVPTEFDIIDSIEKELKDQGLSSKKIQDIIGNYKKSNNVTDAQVWALPELYKQLHEARGTWTPDMDIAHQIAEGIIKPDKIESKYQQLLSAIKPFAYGMEFNNTLGLNIPNQLKCSIMPLYKSYTDLNPLLAEHRSKLEANNIDIIATKSSLKAGLGIRDKFNNSQGDYNNKVTISLDNFGIQVDNPNHLLDEENSSIRQIKMLLVGAIDPDLDYNGTKGIDLINEINELEAKNVLNDLRVLTNKIKAKDHSFSNKIKEQVTSRGATENILTALEVIDGQFRYPLDLGATSSAVENMISSIYTSDVIKQSFKGGSAVQASALGLKYKNLKEQQIEVESNDELSKLQSDLKWVRVEDGEIQYAEAVMPAWAKEFFDKNGFPREDIPEEFRKILVYRIPTEGYHSMLPVKVVKFLPSELGNFILLPYEITTQFGADFDFDKIYFINYEFNLEENGEFKKIEDLDSKHGRNNKILDNYFKVLTSTNTLQYLVKPSGFELLAKLKEDIEPTSPQRNFFSSRTQRDLKERNHVGIGLKGQSALHVSGHSFATILGLNTLNHKEDGKIDRSNVFKFNVQEDNFSLYNLYNRNGELIADELSSMMAAILDDIKNPILETLGINANTIDVWATIVRAGEGTETAINLITQPAIKELSKKLTANTNQIKDIDFKWQSIGSVLNGYESRYQSIIDKFSEEDQKALTEFEVDSKEYNLNDSDMKYWREWATSNETHIIEDNRNHNFEYAKYLLYQQKVLANYSRYDAIAKDLIKINRFFGINKEVGPNIENIIDKKYLYNEISDPGMTVKGIENINNVPQLNAYYNTHLNSLETFREHFPYESDMYVQIKNKVAISQLKTTGIPFLRLNTDKRMKINNFIRVFTDNKYYFSELNDPKAKVELLTTFPKDILKILNIANDKEYYNGALRKSPLFENLKVVEDKNNKGIYNIQLKGNKLDLSIKNTITESMLGMYNNDKTKDFIINLIKHSYLTTGLFSGQNSFHSLIPVEVLEDLGYAEYRKDITNKLSKNGYVLNEFEMQNLIDQLIRNFPQDFTKVFDESLFVKTPNKLIVNEDEIKKRSDIILSKDDEGNNIYVDYIRVYDKQAKNTILYRQINNGEYSQVSKLGLKGKLIEINSNTVINKSIIDRNNITSDTKDEPESNTDTQEPILESGEFSSPIDDQIDLTNIQNKDLDDDQDIDPELPNDITPC